MARWQKRQSEECPNKGFRRWRRASEPASTNMNAKRRRRGLNALETDLCTAVACGGGSQHDFEIVQQLVSMRGRVHCGGLDDVVQTKFCAASIRAHQESKQTS